MIPRSALAGYFFVVLAAMVAVTAWASGEKNVLLAFADLWADRWGRATLFDAYFGFLAVWLWIVWRERAWATRLAWLAALLALGNIGIAVYAVRLLVRSSEADGLVALFGPRPGRAEENSR
ncbi:MAG: DUF1475 family protein [Thermoanaerobaculia bacterium]